MKIRILVSFIALSLAPQLGWASKINCKSTEKYRGPIDGGKSDFIWFEAFIVTPSNLVNAKLDGPIRASAKYPMINHEEESSYPAINRLQIDHIRIGYISFFDYTGGTSDAYFFFPKDFANASGPFTGYLEFCAEWCGFSVREIKCTVTH